SAVVVVRNGPKPRLRFTPGIIVVTVLCPGLCRGLPTAALGPTAGLQVSPKFNGALRSGRVARSGDRATTRGAVRRADPRGRRLLQRARASPSKGARPVQRPRR